MYKKLFSVIVALVVTVAGISQTVSEPYRLFPRTNFRPPQDTVIDPVFIGEIRYKNSDAKFYKCISLTGQKWADMTPSGAGLTVNNNADNRIITATGGSSVDAETNFTYDGSVVNVNSAGFRSTLSSATSEFKTYLPAGGYPRAQFLVGESAADNNIGVEIVPTYSGPGVQKPALIGVSTNKDLDNDQITGYLFVSTSSMDILTLKRAGQLSGGVPIKFKPGGTEYFKIEMDGLITANAYAGTGERMAAFAPTGQIVARPYPTSPTLTNTYVAFGNGSNEITGSPDFTWTGANGLGITTTNFGVTGSASATAGVGIYGIANGLNGTGVYGTGNLRGVHGGVTVTGATGLEGSHSGNSGVGYGVRGVTSGSKTTGTAGYFDASGATNNYALVTDGGNVGIGTTTPVASAKMEIVSTTQGFLLPRMTTTQRDAISSPATGLMVYDTTVNKVSVYNGTTWKYLLYE